MSPRIERFGLRRAARWVMLGLSALPALPGEESRVITYVDNSGGNDISLIDAVTQQAIGSIYIGFAPHGLAASPDGAFLYVSSETEDTLTAVDTATSRILWTAPVGLRPNEISISGDGRYVYVPIRSEARVDVVDTTLHRTIKSIPLGRGPHNSYAAPDGKSIYVTSMDAGNVAIIDIATQAVVGTIPLGGEARPCAITKDNKYLYAQLTGLHGFVVADIAARKVIERVELPTAKFDVASAHAYTDSHGIAIRAGGRQLWAASPYGSELDVFSIPEHKRIGTVTVGTAPDWLDFSPDGKLLFVGNAGSNDVSVIDADQIREIARVPAGSSPKRVLVVTVPRGMGGPTAPGWINAAARAPNADIYLRGGGAVSCSTESFRGQFKDRTLTIESVPALYRRLGIRNIELDVQDFDSSNEAAIDRLAAAIRKEKRLVSALCAAGNVVSDDAEANQRQIVEYKRLLGVARSLGAPVLRIGLGQTGRGDAVDATVGIERAISAIRQLLPVARELGVRPIVENEQGPSKTPEAIIQIIQGTDPLSVGACFNFENWENQKAVPAAVKRLAPYICHVHANFASFNRLGYEESVDYKSGLPLLAETGYGGSISIRYLGTDEATHGVHLATALMTKCWVGKGTAPRLVSHGN